MRPFTWTCPYCGQPSTITEVNVSRISTPIDVSEEDHADFGLSHDAIKCPNPACAELTLKVSLYKKDWANVSGGGKRWINKERLREWQLLPRSRAKPIPEYVPEEIRQNYYEACMIVYDSPKASAAMSRRCLQGIVRDFWNIPSEKRGNLEAEINYIKEKIDSDTYESIKAVREVGDIGAHMEKAVDTIVDVEPTEAELLIGLIETLISDWYISQHRRNERNKQLQYIVSEKRKAKKISKESMLQIENKDDAEDGE